MLRIPRCRCSEVLKRKKIGDILWQKDVPIFLREGVLPVWSGRMKKKRSVCKIVFDLQVI